MRKIRLLIVHRSEIFAQGLIRLIDSEPTIQLVWASSTRREAIEAAAKNQPDVVLIDTDLSTREDTGAIRAISKTCPSTSIIVLANRPHPPDLFPAIMAGAAGYVHNDITFADLIKVITLASHGNVSLFGPIVGQLVKTVMSAGKEELSHPNLLTKRQETILSLVTRGSSNADIALSLSISENTVKVHMRNIMDKLHVNNRQQCAAWAIANGLFSKKA